MRELSREDIAQLWHLYNVESRTKSEFVALAQQTMGDSIPQAAYRALWDAFDVVCDLWQPNHS